MKISQGFLEWTAGKFKIKVLIQPYFSFFKSINTFLFFKHGEAALPPDDCGFETAT